MTTVNPAAGSGNTVIPRYRGNDFEIYTANNNNIGSFDYNNINN